MARLEEGWKPSIAMESNRSTVNRLPLNALLSQSTEMHRRNSIQFKLIMALFTPPEPNSGRFQQDLQFMFIVLVLVRGTLNIIRAAISTATTSGTLYFRSTQLYSPRPIANNQNSPHIAYFGNRRAGRRTKKNSPSMSRPTNNYCRPTTIKLDAAERTIYNNIVSTVASTQTYTHTQTGRTEFMLSIARFTNLFNARSIPSAWFSKNHMDHGRSPFELHLVATWPTRIQCRPRHPSRYCWCCWCSGR